MYYYVRSEELYHHGTKGMKWGVRRYQHKDGTYTNVGKKRRRIGGDISERAGKKVKAATVGYAQKRAKGHRLRLENKYREKGMSDADIKAAVDKHIKVEKAVALTAGVTVAACLGYYAKNKWIADHCDQTLKAGTTFHNLDSVANPRPGEHLYVNYRQNDVNYFRGHFAVNKMRQTGSVFNHTISATEDVKIPSLKTRKSTFKQLYDNDADFRAVFNAHSKLNASNVSAKKAYKAMWPKFGDKNDSEFNAAKHKYFEALKQKGYAAIVDEWDTNPKVFRSDAPLILLDTSHKSLGEMTIKELQDSDVLLAQANSKRWTLKRDALNLVTGGNLHANHFKESERQFARTVTNSAKNKSNIDKFLNAYENERFDQYSKQLSKEAAREKAQERIRLLTTTRSGPTVSKAGEYMSKNPGLSASEALVRARAAKARTDKAVGAAALAGGLVGYYGVTTKAPTNAAVEKYLAEHPNTKMTNKEIEKMLIKQRRS